MSLLNQVQAGIKACGEDFVLKGSLLLVEIIQREIKTQSGIVLAGGDHLTSIEANSQAMVRVVAVGAGHYDPDTNEDVPLDTTVGDILLIQKHTIKTLPTFPILGYKTDSLGLIDESATQIRFRGEAALAKFEASSGT